VTSSWSFIRQLILCAYLTEKLYHITSKVGESGLSWLTIFFQQLFV